MMRHGPPAAKEKRMQQTRPIVLIAALLIAALASFVFAAPAVAETAAEQPAAAATPDVWKDTAASCSIEGLVLQLQTVSTYTAPTSLAETEKHVKISISDRTSRNRKQADPRCQKRPAQEELLTYKVCSPTPIKPGDRIRATEGTETGPSKKTGCLFDIVVLK